MTAVTTWARRWAKRLPWQLRVELTVRDQSRRLDHHDHRLTELAELRDVVRRHGRALIRMEDRMTTFEQAAQDLAELTDQMAERLEQAEATNAQLRAAVAAGDQAKAEALLEQSGRHAAVVTEIAERLRGVGTDPENPVPDTTPLPTPDEVEPVTAGAAVGGAGTGTDPAIVTPDAGQPGSEQSPVS